MALNGQLAARIAELLDLSVKLGGISDPFVPTPVQIADVRVDDVRPLQALGDDIIGGAGVERAYGPWNQDQQRAFFAPVVNDNEVFIFSDGDRQVGAMYLGERDGEMWLELVEVLPEFQRRGYGTRALRWVVARASKQGIGTLLQVHRVNEDARRLYLSEGFSPAGETETHHLLRMAARR
ncbi:GNAT family N-acetyltransferase [Streptomyces sp. NBC_01361]|uniref:GNAT family N-acetyltransferase n=1 Tax=Streptomyces sp. NBC_01361 TaxID=2903838 RepID=UPI003FCCA679